MKKLLAVVLVLVSVLSLCACGKKKDGFTPRLDTNQTATLNIAGFMGNYEALDQTINAFREIYPNVTFLYDHNTTYMLPEYLANNENTDIFMTADRNVTRADLPNTYVVDWCVDLSQEDLDLSALLPEAKKGCIVDGKLVRIPVAMNPCGYVVNNTLLEKEGLQVPTNYQELLSCLSALKAKGYTPLQGSEQHLYGELMLGMAMNLLAQSPEAVADLISGADKAGQILLPAFRELETIIKEGYTDYEINKNFPNDNYNGTIMSFFKGEMPFYVCNSECVSGMKKRESKSEIFSAAPFKYTFLYPATGEKGAYVYSQCWYGFSVNKNSTNKDLAVEFMRFLLTPQWLDAMASIKGMPTTAVGGADERYPGLHNVKNVESSYIADGSIPDFVSTAFTKACNEFGAGRYETAEEAAAAFAGYCANPVVE